jgi:hypothetical protein
MLRHTFHATPHFSSAVPFQNVYACTCCALREQVLIFQDHRETIATVVVLVVI